MTRVAALTLRVGTSADPYLLYSQWNPTLITNDPWGYIGNADGNSQRVLASSYPLFPEGSEPSRTPALSSRPDPPRVRTVPAGGHLEQLLPAAGHAL